MYAFIEHDAKKNGNFILPYDEIHTLLQNISGIPTVSMKEDSTYQATRTIECCREEKELIPLQSMAFTYHPIKDNRTTITIDSTFDDSWSSPFEDGDTPLVFHGSNGTKEINYPMTRTFYEEYAYHRFYHNDRVLFFHIILPYRNGCYAEIIIPEGPTTYETICHVLDDKRRADIDINHTMTTAKHRQYPLDKITMPPFHFHHNMDLLDSDVFTKEFHDLIFKDDSPYEQLLGIPVKLSVHSEINCHINGTKAKSVCQFESVYRSIDMEEEIGLHIRIDYPFWFHIRSTPEHRVLFVAYVSDP
jgi:serine protease inhibitor